MKYVFFVFVGFVLWIVFFFIGNQIFFCIFCDCFDENMVMIDVMVFVVIFGFMVFYFIVVGFVIVCFVFGVLIQYGVVFGVIQMFIGIVVQFVYWSVILFWYYLGFFGLFFLVIVVGVVFGVW